MKKLWVFLFITLSSTALLSGCAETIVLLIGGAQDTHEYYLHYTIDFTIGGHAIHADRYGEVSSVYENFAGTTCDRSKPECWDNLSNFMVTLPNGDIVRMMNVDDAFNHSLSTLSPDEEYSTNLRISEIMRDRTIPNKLPQQGVIACLPMQKNDLLKNYGLASIPWPHTYSSYLMDIKANVQRVDSIPDEQKKYRDTKLKGMSYLAGITYSNNVPVTCKELNTQPD